MTYIEYTSLSPKEKVFFQSCSACGAWYDRRSYGEVSFHQEHQATIHLVVLKVGEKENPSIDSNIHVDDSPLSAQRYD
ncbi:MAG TPA: hypothetical protein VKC60_18885 [Opitutaceae bacterium]|nr:hypothetical protein [Opitutaceae bacterium]